MALFAHLDFEKAVQVNDRTRFFGGKSFVTKGSTAISTMTIKPGSENSAISVFNSDQDEQYLDWQFSNFNIDIDATNNKLDFDEGGSEITATLDSGTYSLSQLAGEIKTQMDAAGAATYTVSVSSDDKITITATSAFSLRPQTGTNGLVSVLPLIGFKPKPGFGDNEFSNKTTVTGKRVRQLPKAVTIEIGDGSNTANKTFYINVFSEDGDALFSSDQDLIAHRDDIMDFVPAGRNTFKHIHRRAQDLILAYFDESGLVDIYGDPLTVKSVVDPEEVRQWSTFLVLRLIHDDLSNSNDDNFYLKARDFESKEKLHRSRSILRLDVNNDGRADLGEGVSTIGSSVVRR